MEKFDENGKTVNDYKWVKGYISFNHGYDSVYFQGSAKDCKRLASLFWGRFNGYANGHWVKSLHQRGYAQVWVDADKFIEFMNK